jgi:uncharacterized protein (TIGR00266 family)
LQTTVHGNPDYGHVDVTLDPGERIYTEGGAMSRMTPGMDLKVRMMGGFVRSIARKLLGGESFFLNEYCDPEGGSLSISPAVPGTVIQRKLAGEELLMTATSFLACSDGVDLKTRFGGLKSLFSGEGAFLMAAQGQGDLFFNAYGAVLERDLDGELTVDTGHVVAWEPSVNYEIKGMGGLKQTLFSGEGLVMRFKGQGKIWLQTRTLGSTAGWLVPYLAR